MSEKGGADRWPFLPTLRGYERSWIGPDLLAGLTLFAIAVPEQMATAHLAGLPEIAGLYAFVAGSFLFALLGRSRQMSVGADSTIAPIIAASVAALGLSTTAASYGGAVSLLALMVGGLVMAVGVLRLGLVAELFSTPVITGVLAGIAVEILVRQLPAVFGIAGGGTSTVGRVRVVLHQVQATNGWALGIAAGVLAVVVLAERLNRRIPGALLGLVASTGLVAALGLATHGVPVVGAVHGGLPHFGLPPAPGLDLRRLVAPALTIAFVVVAQTAATARASSAGATTTTDFNVDLAAIGAGSLAAGMSGTLAVNASPPRTAIVVASGGRSQVAGLVAAGAVLVVIFAATGLLKDLPKATLGAILVFVASRLLRVRVMREILGFSWMEFGLTVVTALTVVFVGIEQGVVLALAVSLADRTRRAARPADAVLGREPGTDHWVPADVGRTTEQVPGVVVYLVYGSLWYGNSDHVRLRIKEAVAACVGARGLVLDADGIADVDYTGAQMLGSVVGELESSGVKVVIARSSHIVHQDLRHSGLSSRFGADRFHDTVEGAVEAVAGTPGGPGVAT